MTHSTPGDNGINGNDGVDIMDTAMADATKAAPDPGNPPHNRKADQWSDAAASGQILAFIVIEIHTGAVVLSYRFPVISGVLRVRPSSLGPCGPLRAMPIAQPVEKRVKNVFNTGIRVL